MNSGIYKITNCINQKVYIGKSINIKDRWTYHKSPSHWKNSKKSLYLAFQKYGLQNFTFEIIEEIRSDNKKLMNERECFWIKYYDSYYNGYNQTKGGDGDISDNRFVTEQDVIDIRTRKIAYESPMEVYESYKNKITFPTFDKIWNGKYYLDIMGNIYEDKEKIKYIEHILKQRMNLEKNNMKIEWILDIRKRRKNGEQRKNVMILYPQIKEGTFDGIWYNKYYKEITEDNQDYIHKLTHERQGTNNE